MPGEFMHNSDLSGIFQLLYFKENNMTKKTWIWIALGAAALIAIAVVITYLLTKSAGACC